MALEAGGGEGIMVLLFVAGGGWVFRMEPMMKNRDPIPMAEINKDFFLPKLSTPKKMKIAVATTLTTPKLGDLSEGIRHWNA